MTQAPLNIVTVCIVTMVVGAPQARADHRDYLMDTTQGWEMTVAAMTHHARLETDAVSAVQLYHLLTPPAVSDHWRDEFNPLNLPSVGVVGWWDVTDAEQPPAPTETATLAMAGLGLATLISGRRRRRPHVDHAIQAD